MPEPAVKIIGDTGAIDLVRACCKIDCRTHISRRIFINRLKTQPISHDDYYGIHFACIDLVRFGEHPENQG